MLILEACELLKKELLDNGYEYGFYLNGTTYKSWMERKSSILVADSDIIQIFLIV